MDRDENKAMANMEAIEQRTLAYLKQVSNPLVSLDALQAHLAEADACKISERDLLDFLGKHELFRVLEPLSLGDHADLAPARPSVILETRVPTEVQLATHMLSQLDVLREALEKALREAQRNADQARIDRVAGMLERTALVREKVAATLRAAERARDEAAQN